MSSKIFLIQSKLWMTLLLLDSVTQRESKCEFIFSSNSSISFSRLNCINGIKGEVEACTVQAINLERREMIGWVLGQRDSGVVMFS